jgi:hypothetical protein
VKTSCVCRTDLFEEDDMAKKLNEKELGKLNAVASKYDDIDFNKINEPDFSDVKSLKASRKSCAAAAKVLDKAIAIYSPPKAE